jgi:sugar O-acyltransferase (sialic acid O-acetyltransferase NeuD family)|tara:strand:+ start:1963 stop:2574 length:612 start_codon:yes stop_codon:yes gene_type:complete
MKNKNNIILIGAGGHALSSIDVIEKENKYKISGLIDENKNQFSKKYKIIGTDNDLRKLRKIYSNALITIGQIEELFLREKIFKKLKMLKFNLPIICSPLAYVSKNASVGNGTIIMHKAIINTKARVGKNCIINTGAIVEHDVIIGDNCHISTGVILNGGVNIGNNSFIGSGAVVRQNIKIGKASFVNANKFISKNLKERSKIL